MQCTRITTETYYCFVRIPKVKIQVLTCMTFKTVFLITSN